MTDTQRLGSRFAAGFWWLLKSVGGYLLAALVVPPVVSLLLPTPNTDGGYAEPSYFDSVVGTATRTWFMIVLTLVLVLPVLFILLSMRKKMETASLRGLAAFLLCGPPMLTAMFVGSQAMLVHVVTNVTFAVVLLPRDRTTNRAEEVQK
ncbi:hypothetical protein [Streptomyces sp. NPDC017529]|uniref:hypothetical protein n=1 Tax=Streptomyces sp. NPDC017529 TaxID=3365000 RepID=UPI0037A9CE15